MNRVADFRYRVPVRPHLCESVCICGSNFLLTAAARLLIDMIAKEWNHGCTQMHHVADRSVGNPMDFETWLAEIEQQTEPEARCLQIIDALRGMHAVQCFHRLQFNHNRALDQ